MNLSAAFLISPETNSNDNPARLPELLRKGGWDVAVYEHEQLYMVNAEVYVNNCRLEAFDLVWPLGFGPRQSFSDRLQMLHLLDTKKLINHPDTYAWAHGKGAWLDFAPLSMVSTNADQLAAFMQANGGDWILKPAAGSFGKSVQRVRSPADIPPVLASQPGYWVLQRFIPEIRQGEVRTLVCAEEILGSYLRVPTNQLHANLAQQGKACVAELDQPTKTLIDKIHQQLIRADVGFAAIDTVAGYLMEVNVANPGGLATLTEVYGDGFAADMHTRLLKALEAKFG